jgi:hypothetical protein
VVIGGALLIDHHAYKHLSIEIVSLIALHTTRGFSLYFAFRIFSIDDRATSVVFGEHESIVATDTYACSAVVFLTVFIDSLTFASIVNEHSRYALYTFICVTVKLKTIAISHDFSNATDDRLTPIDNISRQRNLVVTRIALYALTLLVAGLA